MADDADIASDKIEVYLSDKVSGIRREAASIPEGRPGQCEECGEYSPRLVLGNCAFCRDGR